MPWNWNISSDSANDLTIGWQNWNTLSHPNATLAPQARLSGKILNYLLSHYFDILSIIIGGTISNSNKSEQLTIIIDKEYFHQLQHHDGKWSNTTGDNRRRPRLQVMVKNTFGYKNDCEGDETSFVNTDQHQHTTNIWHTQLEDAF